MATASRFCAIAVLARQPEHRLALPAGRPRRRSIRVGECRDAGAADRGGQLVRVGFSAALDDGVEDSLEMRDAGLVGVAVAFDQPRAFGYFERQIEILHRKLAQMSEFPRPLQTLLEHLIISHHGQYEFGSPKLPMFPEALLLHYLDDLDSKLQGMQSLLEKETLLESEWTGFLPSLGRPILKVGKFLESGGSETSPSAPPATEAPPDIEPLLPLDADPAPSSTIQAPLAREAKGARAELSEKVQQLQEKFRGPGGKP